MMLLGRTRAVANNLIEDIKKILFYTTVLVQSVFFIFYGYSIAKSLDNLLFFIIYSLLFILAVINFIYYLKTHNIQHKKNKFIFSLKIFRYILNLTMIVTNCIQILTSASSDLSKIFLIFSVLSYFVQIVLEFVKVFVERYVELFSKSLELDLEIIDILFNKPKEVKGNFFALLDKPLEAIANKIENKQVEVVVDKKEEKVINIAEEYIKQEKERAKQIRNEKAEKRKQELKEHFNIIKNHIFKKK